MAEKPAYEELEQRVRDLESAESKCRAKLALLQQKETRYRNLFENMLHEVHVWELVFDGRGNIETWKLVDANPAALNSWGKTLPETLGRTTNEIFSDFNATELFMPIVKKIFAKGTPHKWEAYFPPTGQFLRMISIPIGKYFISTGTDISNLKIFEEKLKNREKDLRKSQKIARLGSWRLDLATNQVEWTEELYRMYGFDPSLPPPPYTEHMKLFTPESWQRLSTSLAETAETGIPYELELETVKDDGSNGWMWVRGEAVKNAEGKIIGLWGAAQDIYDRKRAEAEREDLKDQLTQARKMEAIGTLAGGIAHEFNNMLSIIIGNTELAADDIPEWNPASDFIQEIRKASLRAKDVVRKLLSVARKSPSTRKPIQIGVIVEETLELLKKTIPSTVSIQKNILCTTETILADPTEIHQVLINLCANAHHAMREETGVIHVSLEVTGLDRLSAARFIGLKPGDYVKLTVADTGEGIAPEIIDRVCDPYFTTKDVDKGLGMGLAIVDGIIEKHDGAIHIESEVGKGTTVEVLLPLIEAQAEIEVAKSKTPPTGTERILFVDDEPSILKMAAQIIKRCGYEVEGRSSGKEALELFRRQPDRFDLVITDMAMPNMPGDRLALEIMKLRIDVPIILCTGHSDRIDENRAGELGIEAFIMKPFSREDIANKIREVLNEAKVKAQQK